MIIAVTGNIGSGKTAVCRIFEKNGFSYINADSVGHELYKREDIKKQVIEIFGTKILTDDEIDRRKLKNIVFYDAEKLKILNNIMHPEIIKEIKAKSTDNTVIEGALIIESGFEDYDNLILILIDKQTQYERLKGKYNKDEINNILKSQLPQERMEKHADFIIENSDDKEELEINVNNILRELE